jgi:hypothetical protein
VRLDARPQGNVRPTNTRGRRPFRLSVCGACCCATLAGAALPAKARAQQAPPPAAKPASPSTFEPEVVPVGSDLEAPGPWWKRTMASVNSDAEGPSVRAGSVISGGGFALGGHWRETLPSRHVNVDTEYLVSIKGYQSALVDLSSRPLWDGRVTVGFGAEYKSLPQEDFFGLGPGSDVDSHVSYERQGLDTRGWATIRVNPWLELNPTFGHLDTRLLAGNEDGVPSIETVTFRTPVTGVGRQSRFVHAGLGMTIDRRDNPKRTRSGSFVRAEIERFMPVTAADHSFLKMELDARGYVPVRLLSKNDTLALRGVALLTDGTGHDAAPFYFLPRLGGGGLLRGYETSRFVDSQALLASAEYRWNVRRRLQIVTFVDTGTVAPAMRAFQLNDLQTAVGAGVRYRGFRVEYAHGAEGGRLHLGVGMGF